MNAMLEAELLAHLDGQIALGAAAAAPGAHPGRGDPRPRRRRRARPARRHPDRDGPPQPARAGARRVLQGAGALLGVPAHQVTLERLCVLITPAGAPRRARALRRAARPARRDRPRARHQPGAHAPGARLPLPPHRVSSAATPSRATSPRGTARPRRRPGARHAAAPAPRPRPPGLTMPISSFYGLQTSLRGLLAQQRSLDVTGHNVANASTQGYSRQEAVLSAVRRARHPGGRASSRRRRAPRHGRRRAGLPARARRLPRPPVPRPGHAPRRGGRRRPGPRQRRARPRRASDDGINTQLSNFWDAWSDFANAPEDSAARQALVEQGSALADVLRHGRRAARTGREPGPGGVRHAHRARRQGRPDRHGDRAAQRHHQALRHRRATRRTT